MPKEMYDEGYHSVYRKIEYSVWKSWFAWYPVKVNSRNTWFKQVYRRKVTVWHDMTQRSYYEYGTLFDVISKNENRNNWN